MPSYKTKLLLYEDKNAKPVEFTLNTGDKFVHTLQLTNDQQNNLVLFGLYKQKYNGYVNGFFTANINKTTKEVAISNNNAFPAKHLMQVNINR